MLQRIQSMFLFIIIGISIADLFIPLALFEGTKLNCQLSSLNVVDVSDDKAIDTVLSFPLLIVMSAIVLITVTTIFSYKNRVRQMKFCKLNILLNIVFMVVLFFYADSLEKLSGASAQYTMGAFLPLASVVLLFFTNRSVKKDEELVKSTDRLR
jgi:hypothetical protein